MIRGRRARWCVGALAIGWAGCHGGGAARPRPACPASGPVIVTSPEDVAALAGCTRLPGLLVRSAMTIDLGSLTATTIDGDLVIGPTLATTSLSVAGVTEVTGALRVAANGDLTSLYLPALERAGAFELRGNPSLESVSAPALAVVGALILARLPALELLDTRALGRVDGEVTVSGVPALSVWEGVPRQVGGAIAIDAPRLDPGARAAIGAGP
jgi:hypothetical protein